MILYLIFINDSIIQVGILWYIGLSVVSTINVGRRKLWFKFCFITFDGNQFCKCKKNQQELQNVENILQLLVNRKCTWELGFAGLSFLFVCFPGLYPVLDLITQKLSKSCAGSKVIVVNVSCGISFSLSMIILFSYNVLQSELQNVNLFAKSSSQILPEAKRLNCDHFGTKTEQKWQLGYLENRCWWFCQCRII